MTGIGFRQREALQTRDNRVLQPRRQRRVKQSVPDKVGGPGLEPAMSKLLPSRLRSGGDLGTGKVSDGPLGYAEGLTECGEGIAGMAPGKNNGLC